MEIMPQIAIKRAFSTIALIWKEFKDSNGIFKFAEFGTMLQEHYHVLLRGMTKGVDTLENTINSIVRSNIVMYIQSKIGLNFRKKTRFSVGGIHFDPQKYVLYILFEYISKDIIEKLFQLSSYCEHNEYADILVILLKSFLETISKGSLRINSTDKHFHFGRRIISREITNFKESQSSTAFINEDDDVDADEEGELHLRHEINQIDTLLNEAEETEE